EPGRVAYFEEYISRLKKEDEAKKILAEKELEKQQAAANDVASADKGMATAAKRAPVSQNTGQPGKPSDFYFYNPSTVAFGKTQFRKIWGDRSYSQDWRRSRSNNAPENTDPESEAELTPEQI